MGRKKKREKKKISKPKKSCSPRDKCEIIVNYLQIHGSVWLPRGIEVNVFRGSLLQQGSTARRRVTSIVVVLEKR